MSTHTVSPELCTNCGLCAAICPCWVFEQRERTAEIELEMAALCVRCGHCMAACPTQAITVAGLDAAGFRELPPGQAPPEALQALMLHRRSIRAFTDEPVAPELLQRIVDAAATAPMGFPPSGVEVCVLGTREEVAAIVPVSAQQMQGLAKMQRSLVGRLLLRRMVARKVYRALEYLTRFMEPGMERYRRDGLDFFTWGAPAMMLFHVSPDTLSGETDVVLAATYAMLMAESLGLGTIMLGVAVGAVQESKDLRRRYGIPDGNEVLNALAIGHPRYQFRRSVPRELCKVTWVADGLIGAGAPLSAAAGSAPAR